jgi:hypothetical protein
MKLQKPNTPPEQMSTEQLLVAIDSIRILSVEVVEYLSEVLKELRARRVRHDFFADRILRFWSSIADQSLAAEAAILLANQFTIKAILPLPRLDQIAIAKGRVVAVAVMQADGTISSDDLPINRMDAATLRRAFGPEGIRSVYEQADIIRNEGKTDRHGMMTLMLDEHMAKIGNQKIKLEDMAELLRMAGYTVEMTHAPKHRMAS